MTKTRSQTLSSAVENEEHEEKTKLEQQLHSTNNASKNRSKITKNRKPIQAQIAKVKSESVKDNEELLASPKNIFRRSKFTAEQIAKLIGYIENDKMNLKAAAKKVGISQTTARVYYHEYQADPEHKMPIPKTGLNKRPSSVTQQKVENLIHCIVHDGMSINQASKKADIDRSTGGKYYAKYLEDPEQKIPLLNVHISYSFKRCTQKQVTDLIGYVVRDKISVAKASKKASMSPTTGMKYYLKYLHNSNRDIPDPRESNQLCGKRCTNDQVKSLIGYIVNDGMTLLEASIKAHMTENTASKYYKQYLDDPERNIPTPETNSIRKSSNPPTLDQVKSFFCYIIIDKLSVAQAARKAKIARSSGQTYYNKYLKNPNNQNKFKDMTYSVEKMKQLVEIVQKKKMSLAKAADTVHLNYSSARKYYQQYLKNPQYEFPMIKNKQYTQEDVNRFIDYIERDKMSLKLAAREINMDATTAYKYYKDYQNDPEHKIPVPIIRGHTIQNRQLDKYTRIIADIYKNNPSIRPEYEIHKPELDRSDIEIKKELVEEDKKIFLKTGHN